jgi:hypothetical protein
VLAELDDANRIDPKGGAEPWANVTAAAMHGTD